MQDIKIPDIGDVDTVEVIELCVAPGDSVGPDDPIIVIESDKASMEVPAGATGTVAELTVAVGDEVSQGDLIARLEGAASASAEPEPPAAAAVPEPTAPADAPIAPAQEAPDPAAATASRMVIRVPDIGDADEVVVIEVLVSAGDQIEAGDLLVVLESDKASMEVPAEQGGTVESVQVKENDQVSEGSELVTLSVAGAVSPAAAPAPVPAAAASPTPAVPAATAPSPSAAVSSDDGSAPGGDRHANVYAGPAARRLARELGVDLSQVSGTGDKGRVLKEDLKGYVKKVLSSGGATGGATSGGMGIPPIPEVDFSKFGATELAPLGRTRVAGAANLHRSWLNIPHVTNHDDADVTELEAFRKSLKAEAERRGARITPLAFIIKACTHVLKEFPTFNASLDGAGENYILKQYCNIGMAVDTPNGLVVPVIAGADQLGVWELSAAIIELAEAARDRKLKPAQMQGGSFSVSSLGNIGGTGFTPIINPPEVAILGIGRLQMSPVWTGDGFEPRKLLPLSLSYDHRAINGGEAGRFLARLREVLADVRQLIL